MPLTQPMDFTRSSAEFRGMRDELWDNDARAINEFPELETHFSPDDQLANVLMGELRKAEKSIKVAIYVLVHQGIAELLAEKAAEGVQVTVLANTGHEGMDGGASKAAFDLLREQGNVYILGTTNTLGDYSKNHQKYGIVDDKVVCGGSFNWTYLADSASDENMIVARHEAFAERFVRDFAMINEHYEPYQQLFERFDEDGDGVLRGDELGTDTDGDGEVSPQELNNLHFRFADANEDGETTLAELRDLRFPWLANQPQAETVQTMFAAAYRTPDSKLPKGWDLVLVGDTPALGDDDPNAGLVLKGSRSVAPNFMGSATLPANQEIKVRLILRKSGQDVTSVVDVLTGNTNNGDTPKAYSDGQTHTIKTNELGVPQIERLTWTGDKPDVN